MSVFPLSEALDPASLRSAMQRYCAAHDGAYLLELLNELAHPNRLLFFPRTAKGPHAHRKLASLKDTPLGLQLLVYSSMAGFSDMYAGHAWAWSHVSELIEDMRARGGGTLVVDAGEADAICIIVPEVGEQAICALSYLQQHVAAARATLN